MAATRLPLGLPVMVTGKNHEKIPLAGGLPWLPLNTHLWRTTRDPIVGALRDFRIFSLTAHINRPTHGNHGNRLPKGRIIPCFISVLNGYLQLARGAGNRW
jgi:hypothetical protein